MKKNYLLHAALGAAALLSAPSAMAIDQPGYFQTPADGHTYMLVSRLAPASFVIPTSWDQALYLMPYDTDAVLAATVTARLNDGGTWSFYRTNGEGDDATTVYMGIPGGTDNLYIKEVDPVEWEVLNTDVENYYFLKAGTGQGNPSVEGGYLHLNNGGQFLVITEPTNGWFPDFYGGVERDEFNDPVFDDDGFVVPTDPISRYWAFVDVDDIAVYAQKMELWALLQDLEDNYVALDEFGTGFQSALSAALEYYNKADFTADDLAAAKALVNAKKSLYNEILVARLLLENGDPDAAFSQAIDKAVSTFGSTNDTATLEEAVLLLKEAERVYALTQEDMTVLLQNPSFEDLSSQNGAETSGIAAPPTGWNVFVNGEQVTTAADVRNAGIVNWHGINSDATGAKDGNLAFGLWTSGVPTYEISQTLTGLENGTYTIQAALMVGANGNGSRRTTQRIFGNLNAKYFGASDEYDEDLLDKSEVYGFQGLMEPVTDQELQEMEVRAFVYDGTLTLGLRTDGNIRAARRESSNQAGGDGWFKVDNFRLLREGYIQADALAVYQHFVDQLTALRGEKMQKSVRDELTALLQASVGTASTEKEIIDAIIALRGIYPTVLSSANAYASLLEAINKGEAALVEYPFSTYAEDFGDLLTDAQDMYDFATVDETAISDMIAQIERGIEELKATAISIGDITYVLKNPGFEDLSAQGGNSSSGVVAPPAGWTLKLNGQEYTTAPNDQGLNWCAINTGDDITRMSDDGEIEHFVQYTEGTHLWGIWANQMPEVELSQTVKNVPPGTYTLKVDVLVQNNGHDNITTQRIFGNNYVQMYCADGLYTEEMLPEDARTASQLTYAGYVCEDNSTDFANPMEVTFGVGDDGVLTIGFRTSGIGPDGEQLSAGWGWFKLDNFRLSYDSEQVPEGVEGVTLQTESGRVRFYTIDGRQLQAPQRGLNIMTTGTKTVKVMVK